MWYPLPTFLYCKWWKLGGAWDWRYCLWVSPSHIIMFLPLVLYVLKVRMSASIATREFLTHIHPKEAREVYFPTLLPAMCLNRCRSSWISTQSNYDVGLLTLIRCLSMSGPSISYILYCKEQTKWQCEKKNWDSLQVACKSHDDVYLWQAPPFHAYWIVRNRQNGSVDKKVRFITGGV